MKEDHECLLWSVLIGLCGYGLIWFYFLSPEPLNISCFSYGGDVWISVYILDTRNAKSNKALVGYLDIVSTDDRLNFSSDINQPSVYYKTDSPFYKDTFEVSSGKIHLSVSNDKKNGVYFTTPLKCFELSQEGLLDKIENALISAFDTKKRQPYAN